MVICHATWGGYDAPPPLPPLGPLSPLATIMIERWRAGVETLSYRDETEIRYLFSINTDDPRVFDTDLPA